MPSSLKTLVIQIVLALPAGRYRVDVKDASGKVVRSQEVRT